MIGKHGQGTLSTKMGADKSAENTPNAPKRFGPICLLVWDFPKKALWVSVVRVLYHHTTSTLKFFIDFCPV